jgi:hypothetical protein
MPLSGDATATYARRLTRALRDRLDAIEVAAAQAEPGVVIELRRDASGPSGSGTR